VLNLSAFSLISAPLSRFEHPVSLQRPKLLRPNGDIFQYIDAEQLAAKNTETWPFFNQVGSRFQLGLCEVTSLLVWIGQRHPESKEYLSTLSASIQISGLVGQKKLIYGVRLFRLYVSATSYRRSENQLHNLHRMTTNRAQLRDQNVMDVLCSPFGRGET
jgi:hypothetical protein